MNYKFVLIADDEDDITWSISRSLKRDKKHIKICCARSGLETIKLLKKHSFDLLITDLRMPGIDGFSVVKYISDNCLPTKIIVMTAFGSDEVKERILNQGCSQYVEKPFEISSLKQKIYSILEKKTKDDSAGGNQQQDTTDFVKGNLNTGVIANCV